MPMKPLVTVERLRELLVYVRKTGRFYWRRRHGAAGAGYQAGSCHSGGYWTICIDRRAYYAHRLAWAYVHGEHPTQEIDHKNGLRADNRISNLRQGSRTDHARNVGVRSATGFKGVSPSGRKWAARIQVDGRRIYLGRYDTPEQAGAAYDRAARRYFGEFAKTNAQLRRAAGGAFKRHRIPMRRPPPAWARTARYDAPRSEQQPRGMG
jgi:hypothetical protein